jgi:ABC-type transport system substrate-binding protein
MKRVRTMARRLPKGFSGLLLGSLFFIGCSDSSEQDATASGETVLYSQTAKIRGLDPAAAGEVSSAAAISRVYEGLLQYDYLARPYKVVPLLAAEMPTVSSNGLVYTFRLRDNIYFQDDPCFPEGKGRRLVAEDFVYSIKRVADVKNASSGFWTLNGRIKGIDAFHEASRSKAPTDYSMEVEGLRALDEHTLQIELTAPYPQLLYILAMQYTYAVPREAVEFYQKDFVNHPVGTGPYRLVRWKRNSRIEFERNPKWAETGRIDRYPSEGSPEQKEAGLLKDAGQPVPFIDRVVQYVIDDSSTAWMMFLSGQLSFSAISRDNWDAVISGDKKLNNALEKRGVQLISAPTLDVYYIGFNWEDPVVGYSSDPAENERHKKLRQALSCAYNFDLLNQFMNYRLHPIDGPVPSPLDGCLKTPSPYRFNLKKAKQLLAEAGYPNGRDPRTGRRLELSLELGGADANTRQSMELLADMYRKIGVVLKPSYNTWPAFIEKMNRRQAQMFRLGWVADYPDAENFLQLFCSANASPGPNHSNYRNLKFDQLYEQIHNMPDSPERTALYEKMAHIIVEDCPWIFLFQPMSFALKHDWVENYLPHDFPYGMGKYYRINPDRKADWKQNRRVKLNFSGKED